MSKKNSNSKKVTKGSKNHNNRNDENDENQIMSQSDPLSQPLTPQPATKRNTRKTTKSTRKKGKGKGKLYIDLDHKRVIHYQSASKDDIIKEYNAKKLTSCDEEECILPEPYSNYYIQLKEDATKTPITWVVCRNAHIHALKLITSSGLSVTTSSLKRHPCYVKWRGLDPDCAHNADLSSQEVDECRSILQDSVIKCIVDDIRPVRFTEGSGIQQLIEGGIKIGVMLGRMPGPSDVQRLIPKKDANRSKVMAMNVKEQEKLKDHLSKLDKQILPAFHATYDYYEDQVKKRKFFGCMGVEANYKTQTIDTYSLHFGDFETLNAMEIQGMFLFSFPFAIENCF